MQIYNARLRHGHAPGHVRDTLINVFDEFLTRKPYQAEPVVQYEMKHEPHLIPISHACKLGWNCTDIVPGDIFDSLCNAGLEIKSRTYAACARAVHAEIIRSRSAT
jgi:hypothetical protein